MGSIEVERLVVDRGATRAVDGVSFAVDQGELVALLGPNGAGKTTTVDVLAGYLRPTSGSVRVLGLDPVGGAAELRRSVGLMPQSGGAYPGLRPLEAIRLFAAYHDDPLDPAELLERVGLGHKTSSTWRRLSGGEQQRLSLALAVVGRPRVVYLDEPTAGIDVGGRQAIRGVVDELRKDGVAVLLTTHDLEEAERVADRVVIVDRGVVVGNGTPGELMRAGDVASFAFTAPPGLDTASLGRVLGAFVDEGSPGDYVVQVAPTPSTVATLTAWLAEHDLPLGDLRAGRQRLADVFLRLTGGERGAA